MFNVRVATTVDDGVAVTFNVGDVVTIDVIVVVYAGTVVDVDVVNACRKKNFHRSPKLTLCVTCVLFFMITSKKFRRKKTIKREVVWLVLHVAFSAFLPFAAKSSQRHESKVGAAKSKTFLMYFSTQTCSA